MNEVLKLLQKSPNVVYFGVSGELKKNWFNYGIEWYTKTDYSHALSMFYSIDAQDFVVTNSHGVGVQYDNVQQFFKGSVFKRLYEVKVDNIQRLQFIRKTIELDGTPYSKKNIVGMVFAKIIHARVNPFADRNKAIFCSEYTCKLSKAAGIAPACDLLNIGPELVTPKHVVTAFKLLSITPGCRVKEINLPKV